MHPETAKEAISLIDRLIMMAEHKGDPFDGTLWSEQETNLLKQISVALAMPPTFPKIIPDDLPSFNPDLDIDHSDGHAPNNGDRAERAYKALETWIGTDQRDDTDQTALQDLLGDLMHLAHRDGLDFNHALELGARNFIDESTCKEPEITKPAKELAYAHDVLKRLENKLTTDGSESVLRLTGAECAEVRIALSKLV